MNSETKRKKEKTIKIDEIDKVVDRCFFVCLNWAFPNRYTYPHLTFLILSSCRSKIENSLNHNLKNIPLCCVNVGRHGTFYRF